MKKQYSKPGIIIEDFTLSQHIASCGVPHESQLGSPKHWSKTSCAWQDMYGRDLFIESMTVCTKPVAEDGEVNGICYNNPSGLVTIFGS